MKMQRVFKRVSKEDSGYDFDFWMSLTPEERLKHFNTLLKNNLFNPITEEHKRLLKTHVTIVNDA